MKFLVGVALVALAGLSASAMAQTAPAAPAAKVVTRMACKNEAVTGSFTRKARQCRHAVTTKVAAPKAQEAARVQPAPAPAPAAAATVTPPASTEIGTDNETKGQ